MQIICDFDGTISIKDTLDLLLLKKLPEIEFEKIKDTDDVYKYFDSNEDLSELNDSLIDCYFKTFFKKNKSMIILSSGFKQIIKKLLPFFPETQIYSNDLNKLNIIIDKRKFIETNDFKNNLLIYIGDGNSDIPVLDIIDVLYVKNNSILQRHCEKNNIEFYKFNDFKDLYNQINQEKNYIKLFSPGVVKVSKKVLNSFSQQHICMHRQKEFHELYYNVNNKLLNILNINSDKYISLILSGSGTSAMDEVINSIIYEKTLFLSNGMFGERWRDIGNFYNNLNCYSYTKNWGEDFDIKEILNIVKKNNIKNVIVVHCDTSNGILNDIKLIGNEIKKLNPSIIYVVDCVSTFGSIPIDVKECKINYLVTNPNKGLASFMGIAIIIADIETTKNLNKTFNNYSYNLKRHLEFAQKNETCNTISIQAIYALYESLMSLNIEKNYNDIKYYYKLLYQNIKFPKLLCYQKSSPAIITILCENSVDIINYLYKHSFVVYECKKDLYNKGFQISLFGEDVNEKNVISLIKLINQFKK